MFKRALYPIALLYGVVISLRNYFFDLSIFKSVKIDGKSICVGNLAVGGTGKSPHVAHLIALLSARFTVQVLSRGYGRQTKGYIAIDKRSTAAQVGDEPLMLFEKFHQQAQFAVCENRTIGIQNLRGQNPNSLILLDDAFQHRKIKAGLNIVLTVYASPMHLDYLLPLGKLREPLKGLRRADAIVVTKCPSFDSFDAAQFAQYYQKWKIPVFFSRNAYQPLLSLTRPVEQIKEVLIVSAIAQPYQLQEAFADSVSIRYKSYSDHHAYTPANMKDIHQFFDTFASEHTAIVTTSKDWVKIQSLISAKDQQKYPWYLLTFELDWSDPVAFNQFISAYVDAN